MSNEKDKMNVRIGKKGLAQPTGVSIPNDNPLEMIEAA